jgi:(heptosyl)LPS beta-1,4-glucosyltransferase
MNKLSVVLATHNEEKNLKRCLEAIKSIADEIIIADGESKDQTQKIAEKYQAKIIKTTNKANFHINKQMAMDEASHKLVLQLDADEVADQELIDFIKKLKKQNSFENSAWWIRRKNLFLNKWLKKGGQYPDPVIRLYINGKAKLPCKDVHEQISVDGKVGWAKGHFWHYSNPEFKDYMRKFNSYTSFTANSWHQEKIQANFLYFLKYFCLKPNIIFFKLYLRHKGFIDGIPGFVFALFSALHYPVAYLKLCEIQKK